MLLLLFVPPYFRRFVVLTLGSTIDEALSTAGKLTTNQLKILILNHLLDRQVFRAEPKTWSDVETFLESKAKPFMDFENREADFTYLDYCGCCNVSTSFGPTSYAQILKNQLSFLFPQLGKVSDEQRYIEEEISSHLSLGTYLMDLWRGTQLWAVDLTVVGLVIAATFYEVYTGEREAIPTDEYFSSKEVRTRTRP